MAPVHSIHFLRRNWVLYAEVAAIVFAVAATYFMVNKRKRPQLLYYKGNVTLDRLGSKIKLSDGLIIMMDTVNKNL